MLRHTLERQSHVVLEARDQPEAVRMLQTMQPAVVLSELRRGAHTPKAQQLVIALRRLARVQWEPTADDWWEAGRVVRKIGNAQTWDRHKRQEFQNDALIGLTARRHGATVVTANGEDFRLLATELRISVLPV